MPRTILLACLALVTAPFVLATHTAQACSCVEPRPSMLSPSPAHKAPLNTRVRVELPTYLPGKLALRKHGGAEIAVKRTESPAQDNAHVELEPTQPLEADTRYEVALIHAEAHPSTLVFGTFLTGNAADTVAPSAAKISKTIATRYRAGSMSSCAVRTPWIEVFLSGAHDPDHDDAQLLHAVWASNARGVIDLKAPPTAYVMAINGKMTLGKTSYCDNKAFPLPRQGAVTLAIATVDEAGNRSAVQRVQVVMNNPAAGNP